MLSITKAYYRGYQAVMKAVIKIASIKEPELVCGPGSLEKLPGILKAAGIERILVVASHSMMKSGGLGGFFKRLEAEGISSSVYDRVQPNPSIDNIEDCLKAYNEGGSGAIVAIGGGSPIDCAKVVAARVACPGRPIRALRGYLKVRGRLPPLYAVPTTAGSGSEATIAAVVTDSATHEKYAITDFKLVPGFAVLDPALTVGLPAPHHGRDRHGRPHPRGGGLHRQGRHALHRREGRGRGEAHPRQARDRLSRRLRPRRQGRHAPGLERGGAPPLPAPSSAMSTRWPTASGAFTAWPTGWPTP